MPPVVSVLMPVRNGRSYLQEAVESILGQSFSDWEFLIADDGSTDDSLDILKHYAGKDSRIHVLSRPSRGLAKTLNELFEMSSGQFLARMDGDDIAEADRLEGQMALLRSRPDVVCTGGCFELIDRRGRLLTVLKPPADHLAIEEQTLAGHGAICHPTALIRRDAMLKIGGYDEEFDFAEDLDLWLRLGEVGKLFNLQRTVLKYRLHERSVSETHRHEQRRFARMACERAWKRRGIQGTFEAAEPWRPGADAPSKAEYALKYGWWAFKDGSRRTAFHYGVRAVMQNPLRAASWRLLLCAAVKPQPLKPQG